MKSTSSRPRSVVSSDGRGVVGHAGSRLLADLAEATGLEAGFIDAVAPLRQRAGGHAPGRVALDLAVMLADGGEAISDLAVLRDQAELFGPVASAPTAWRVLKAMDYAAIARLRGARAAARELAWAQRTEVREALPQATAAGRAIPGLVLDIDASIVICHSEKQNATGTWKKTFGYHPIFCFLDNTGEALSGILRPGRAGSNTAADHIEVLDLALAQIPDAHRHGASILVRADTAGCTHSFLAHIRALRGQGVDVLFSVGAPIDEPIREAITALPANAWYPAIEADGQVRDGAEVAELTGLLYGYGANLPTGTRFLVRRERPHPGAQLSLFDTIEGYRHQVIATDSPLGAGPLTWIEARHRAHARVEDRIRTGKDSGFGRFPSREFAINQAWLELALTGIDLTCWMRMLCSTANSRSPNRRSCATGCSTSQHGSPRQPDAPGCASPGTGHGRSIWSQPSNALPRYPVRAPADQLKRHPLAHEPKGPRKTPAATAPGPWHAHTPSLTQKHRTHRSDHYITAFAKDGG